MKVFVVSTHYESYDDGSTTTINGVRSSLESAQKLMKECLSMRRKQTLITAPKSKSMISLVLSTISTTVITTVLLKSLNVNWMIDK